MLFDQAVFTSVRGTRMDGYQLSATSEGVTSADAKALGQWGPAHDSLQDASPYAASVSFLRLPSGALAMGRTQHDGAEYSGRGGMRVLTRFLIGSQDEFGRFANQPFRLLEAVEVAGHWEQFDEDQPLEPLLVGGRAPSINANSIARLAHALGAERLLRLLDAALSSKRLAFTSTHDPRRLLDGLIDLVPPPLRPDFSFTTGLKVSARRPFRWIHCRGDHQPRPRAAANEGLKLADLADLNDESITLTHPWTRRIAPLLIDHKLGDFGRLMNDTRRIAPVERLEDLVAALDADQAAGPSTNDDLVSTTNAPNS